ncbi:hypothetical protein F5Y02DRAFT_424135 [Annulohypoxylon stygium]|nr:hypothetical protein F5Y02DRAFT_424135 [Annulohypoxylon stygium]
MSPLLGSSKWPGVVWFVTGRQRRLAYNNIVFDVGTFVQTRMESLWRNNEHFDKAGIWARTGMYDFHNELLHFPDLYTTVLAAGNTSDIDDEILESFILRRIQHVFNLGLEAINPTVGRALGWAEQSMRNEKRLAEYQIRNWRAETQFALLQDPQIQKDWQTHKDAFLNAMARVLGFLAKGDEDHDAFVNDMATEIVNPAYKLLEQCLGTTSGFSLGTQTIGMLGQNFHGKLADLMKVQCQNVISGMNYFRVDRINPAPSENQLHRELHIMCSLSPSFLYFQASPTTIAKENAILQPELLMVAWRAGEDGQSAISTLPKTWDRPILYGLLTACLQTQTKGN